MGHIGPPGPRPARRSARIISCEQGMYLVTPLVVPEVTAKVGMRPGQVQASSSGKAGFQYASQKSS